MKKQLFVALIAAAAFVGCERADRDTTGERMTEPSGSARDTNNVQERTNGASQQQGGAGQQQQGGAQQSGANP